MANNGSSNELNPKAKYHFDTLLGLLYEMVLDKMQRITQKQSIILILCSDFSTKMVLDKTQRIIAKAKYHFDTLLGFYVV